MRLLFFSRNLLFFLTPGFNKFFLMCKDCHFGLISIGFSYNFLLERNGKKNPVSTVLVFIFSEYLYTMDQCECICWYIQAMQRIFEMISSGNGYCTQNECYPTTQQQQQQQQQMDTLFGPENLMIFSMLLLWVIFSIYYFLFLRPNIRSRKVLRFTDRDNEGIM